MSELQTRFIDDTYAEYYNTGKHELAQIYLKSEADKVIAEKDAKILALDAEVFKQKHHAELFLDERNYAETQLRKQKFKRCLDKAKWCDTKGDWYYSLGESFRNRVDFYIKWRDKWIKIAEKLKETR